MTAVPASLAGLLGLAAYVIFAFFCRNKAEGNEVHPYIAFLPIIRLVNLAQGFAEPEPPQIERSGNSAAFFLKAANIKYRVSKEKYR